MQTLTVAETKCAKCSDGIVDYIVRGELVRTGAQLPEWKEYERVLLPPGTSDWEIDSKKNPDGSPMYPRSQWRREAAYCECYHRRIRERRLAKTQNSDDIPHDLAEYPLSRFEDVPHAGQGLGYVRNLIEDGELIDRETKSLKKGVLLMGKTGSFKTRLIGQLYLVFEGTAYWMRHGTFLSQIRATYNPGYDGKSWEVMVDEIKRYPLLIVDDWGTIGLGKQDFRDALEAYRIIFDYRLNHQLLTGITTNLYAEELMQQYQVQVMSRVHGLCAMCVMDSPRDVRMPQRKQVRS